MPVARRSAPRRRVFRTRAKYDYQVTTRRYKRLLPIMWPELDWELYILDQLEQEAYALLEAQGIPTDQQNYYVGFTKKLWERRIDFGDATYAKEKESLENEYTLRGLDPTLFDPLQDIAEKYAEYKVTKVPPAPPGYMALVLGGNEFMAQFFGTLVLRGQLWAWAQYCDALVLGGREDMAQFSETPLLLGGNSFMIGFGGVLVVLGAVT